MSTPVITIFVRHGFTDKKPCRWTGDEFSRKCKCPKHLRWTVNGKQYRQAAKARTWEEAERAKRELEDQLTGCPVTVEAPQPRIISECIESFLKEKTLEDIAKHSVDDYRRILTRLNRDISSRGVYAIDRVTREHLLEHMAAWPSQYPSSWTRWRLRSRLNSFLAYCVEAGWMSPIKLPRVTVDEQETTPLTPEEFNTLLASTSRIKDPVEARRLRSLFLLMRYTGLAIRDALQLSKAEMTDTGKGYYRVTTSRQKTGTDVSVPVQAAVALELLDTPNDTPEYFFWDGKRDGYLMTVSMGQRVKKVFTAAGLDDGQHMKSHRLRDTFAVELLSKGVPMEEVSKMLGHTSIKTTEKHYAKWAKGRQDRVDSLVTGTWAA